jgi:alanine dehydrogenase
MIIGIPKEIKSMENRVSMTPGGAESLVRQGHTVLVEAGAGLGSSCADEQYVAAGCKLVSAAEAWGAEMVIKVKEPLPEEFPYLRKDLLLFTYLHLAAAEPLTTALLDAGTTSIAYETVKDKRGTLPLLTPMSEVAGRMATQVGAHFLEKAMGGRGILLGGTPGTKPGNVLVIGAGVVGTNAARIAVGLGAQVVVMDLNHDRLQYLDDIYQGRISTMSSNDEPTYVVDGVVHYGVANMPGAVPRTSTFALVNQTLPYALRLAARGLDALREDAGLALGLNTLGGTLTCPAVGEAFGISAVAPESVL